ncbi:MAG TPA: hypothetical protein VFB79_23270 [Candidatus Angelobacter sp.]|nr:hypothetical protein [Candidatus Angelobacter sp.]
MNFNDERQRAVDKLLNNMPVQGRVKRTTLQHIVEAAFTGGIVVALQKAITVAENEGLPEMANTFRTFLRATLATSSGKRTTISTEVNTK